MVVVSMGDPAGIGREVILKAAAALARKRHPPALAVVGDLAAMSAASRDLGISTPKPFGWARSHPLPRLRDGLAVIDIGRLRAATMRAARPSVAGGDAAYRYIVEGSRMALAGEAGALVTAPINKEWMNRAGHHFPGKPPRRDGQRRWQRRDLKIIAVADPVGYCRDGNAHESTGGKRK